jgi:2'-hydroxyisoflavone reductase
MKILILGGTVFLGRHLADTALMRGHEVTLFNRGVHNPDLFPEAFNLRGDRDGDLHALVGHSWEAVIDTCGYVPRIVNQSANMLSDLCKHYTFISSISVYGDLSQPGIDEDTPVGALDDTSAEEITGETYGPLKALCEREVTSAFPGRALIIRPGLIVGPHDPTDRFTYWPSRVARGGDILAPRPAGNPVQFIDVRDLAGWILDLIEKKRSGVFNAVGPDVKLSMKQFLELCLSAIDVEAGLIWIDAEFLLESGVEAWSELPLWLPGEDYAGMMEVNIQRAISSGLTFHSLEGTIMDTLTWAEERESQHEWRAGLDREKEKDLLIAFRAQSEGD